MVQGNSMHWMVSAAIKHWELVGSVPNTLVQYFHSLNFEMCIMMQAVWIFLLGIKLVGSEDDDDFAQDDSSSFESTNDLEQAWKHCSKWSKSIEVFYKKDDEDKKVLAKVHYRFYPTVSAAHSAVWLLYAFKHWLLNIWGAFHWSM